jgi:hypothetical protein
LHEPPLGYRCSPRKKTQLKLQKLFAWLKGDGGDELEERKNNDTRTWEQKREQMEKIKTGADVTQGTEKILKAVKGAMRAMAFKKNPSAGLDYLSEKVIENFDYIAR